MATLINLYPTDEINTIQPQRDEESQRGSESTQRVEASPRDRSHTAQVMDTDK